MKALVYRAPGEVEVAEVPKPRIEQPTDAIVRVTTASICGSDLHIYHGALGMADGLILGHEFVGVFTEDVTLPMTMLSVTGVTVRTGLAGQECRPRMLAMVERGDLDLTFAFSHTLPLSEAARAYRLFDRKEDGALKILLKP